MVFLMKPNHHRSEDRFFSDSVRVAAAFLGSEDRITEFMDTVSGVVHDYVKTSAQFVLAKFPTTRT
jgi:hypothetical protein